MIILTIKIVFAAVVVWSFFMPELASTTYIIFVIVFEGYIVLMSLLGRPRQIEPFVAPLYFTLEEVASVQRYHLFFRYPYASRQFSGVISFIQLTSIILVIWFLYKGFWIKASILGLNYYPAGYLAVKLNPRFFLERAKEKDAGFAKNELQSLDSAIEKYLNASADK